MSALEKVLHDIIRNAGHDAISTPTLWDNRIILCPVTYVEHTDHTVPIFVWPQHFV